MELHRRPLISSNIFDTAHGMFGSLLVLSATHVSRNQSLAQLVDGEQLYGLLEQTLGLLKANGSTSPVMRLDEKVISYIRDKLFPSNVKGDV